MAKWDDEFDKVLAETLSKKSSAGGGKSTNKVSSGVKGSAGSYMQNKANARTGAVAPITSSRASQLSSRTTKKKKEERKWFQKGAFEDGWDFGDVTKTILGTGADILEDLGSGIAEMPEKIADATAMIAPYYAQSQLNQAAYSTMDTDLLKSIKAYDLDEEKKKAGEFVKKDLYDGKAIAHGILNPVTDGVSAMIGQDFETASVLGEKADSTVESGGQMLATMGLQAVGVPWFVTTGVTSFGAESENALNQGAEHEEAMGSAAISAAAEILTEKIGGGIKFGGKAWDDALSKMFARTISNKLGRTAARLGVDFAGEAGEELLSQVASNIGSSLYRDESLKEILFSEEAFDEYLDAMIGGGLLGGVSGGFKAIDSTRKGVDYVSELTANEQKVVDKVYQDRVAEAEKDGKISQAKKSKIYDEVLDQMDKGYISTDTIEEVLGGETFNSYKYASDFLSEYDKLGAKEGATPKDNLRYSELTPKANELRKNMESLRPQLQSEVSELVKNDRLAESYNELTRKTQKYEADLTKYDEKQRTVIQKAVDSGILNNTNRTHEFVDFVAKISADKGVLFDFANNAKIKETGFAVEGKTVNGYVTKDGVTLNIDSAKSLNSVVGHEITHVLEGTELYSQLQTALFEYAKPKGDYLPRFNSLKELYKDSYKDLTPEEYEAEINKEVTSDLIGDLLFTDSDFVKRLSTENRNIFQKVFDEIKYLCKVATAGSKEAKQLLQVKKAFEEAYRESGKAPTETKYSVSESKSLYTGSPNTNIQQFKVGGVDGSKQTGDRYGRGVYLTTNESTAQNYAGESGRVYKINADDLNIFNLNDTITAEMQESLIKDFNSADKQFRNSMLRNFRTEKTFNDFDSAEKFFDEQRSVWKTQDGYYSANKPEIKSADSKTGKAVIEFTDFENWESNIGTLTGNQLYDALKSISTDDFSYFITGHGFDGIAFDEDSDNQQYVIYKNEDKLHIDNGDVNATVKYSLSEGEQKSYGNYNVYGKDIALENSTAEQKTQLTEDNSTVSNQEMVDAKAELDKLYDERQVLKDTIESLVDAEDFGENFKTLTERWAEVDKKIDSYEDLITNLETTDTVAPVPVPEPTAPYWFSEEIASIVDELSTQDTGEPRYGKQDVFVIKDYTIQRRTLKDGTRWHYSIISPDGTSRFNIVEADKNAFYGDVAENLESIMRIDFSDEFEQQKPDAFAADAPVRVVSTEDGDYLKTDKNGFEEKKKPESKRAKILTEMPPQKNGKKTDKADSINVQQETQNGIKSPLKLFEEYVIDNGFVFEKISKKTKNRELEAKWDGIRRVRSAAQHLIGEGLKYDGVKSLKSMMEQADKAGLTQDFYDYMHHWLNFDRMTVEDRYPNSTNRGVFGQFPASESLRIATKLEQEHPEFKTWAEEVYSYNRHLRSMLVDGGIISQKTADLWEEMFPHYVPIRRVGFEDVFDDLSETKNASFKTPVYEFEGSNRAILPMFNTMAERTMAVYRAVAMNNFGTELYNTLYPGRLNRNIPLEPGASNVGVATGNADYFIDGFDPREELLQSGKPGSLPTFSIFIDGERHTFDITSEMYTAMKQTNDLLSANIPILSGISNLRRNLITAYSPWFTLKNAIKDTQEIIINSQHPLKTYATLLEAGLQIAGKGTKYQEYVENGGEQNTYFDSNESSFDPKKGVLDYVENTIGLKQILAMNNYIEMLPRLAEYIASRSEGRSIEVSMLDAARVTTNFGAGGKLAKFLDRNGCTFLNSSIQGFTQQARNVVEAKQNGVKGFLGLAARYLVAGLPAVLLNHALWDDDEDYQALPDYITNNYYVPFKYGDGQFVRIPKGRTAAVIQNAIEQVARMSSGDDEADWNEFFKIAMENIAPNNPLTDNIFAPIVQTATNTTWYGEDIIPYRLKDLPASEQFDEKTDALSIWLGEKLDYSPKKINYLVDQYSGVLGDTFLPMSTPKAESPIDNPLLKLGAPLRDIFTTDSVLNNRVTGDFYETLESVEAQAESEDATPEDKFKSDLLISYNVEISKLMQEQRDIQTSDLPDSEKYKRNRVLKEQINALQEKGLEAFENYSINGIYAEAGGKRFNFGYDTENDKERWFEIKPKKADGEDNWYYQQEQAITKDLGISYGEYWNNREMYDAFYYVASGFDKESSSDDTIETARSVFGYERFAEYASVLKTLKADKDANGESISGTRFDKVKEYVDGLDVPDIEKKILMKMQYPNYKKHNYEIVKYLDEREDISYDEWIKILDELGYMIDDNNYVTW